MIFKKVNCQVNDCSEKNKVIKDAKMYFDLRIRI